GLCPRTWNRAPTPSVARGHALIKINKINYLIIKYNFLLGRVGTLEIERIILKSLRRLSA
ncbi:MAG TPA: hypothetical protein PK448_06385, partial [Bacteroidales bacterium]|nr:hypothetical protein [Bacteroidales bacterium]